MKVGIVILHKNKNEILFECLKSIKTTTKSTKYMIYVGDTGSSEDKINEVEQYLRLNFPDCHKLIKYNFYNFGVVNNDVVEKHVDQDIDVLLFCNNDIVILDECIDRMSKYMEENRTIGTLGCKLLFPDYSIQHAGQLILVSNKFLITHRGIHQPSANFVKDDEVIGNTAAFMMISKAQFLDCGGFSRNYVECFEDVELNLQMLLKGRKNICLNSIRCIHHESKTRGHNPRMQEMLLRDYYTCLVPFMMKNLKGLTPFIKKIKVAK